MKYNLLFMGVFMLMTGNYVSAVSIPTSDFFEQQFTKKLGERACRPLHDAAKAGDTTKISQLLNQGSDINVKGCFNIETPLNTAVVANNIEVVRLFISRGAQLNVTDQFGNTPLHAAAERNNIPIMQVLIAANADLHAKEKTTGATPLHIASLKGHLEAMRTLLDGGAGIENVNNVGQSPLFSAVVGKQLEAVRLLLSRRASKSAKDTNGRTPLALARLILNNEDLTSEERVRLQGIIALLS